MGLALVSVLLQLRLGAMVGCIASKVGPDQCLRGGGGGFLQCLLCDMRLRGVNSLLCRWGGGSSSVAMSKLHKCFVPRRTRGKSMFSNEASSLRFNLNPGPKRKVKC